MQREIHVVKQDYEKEGVFCTAKNNVFKHGRLNNRVHCHPVLIELFPLLMTTSGRRMQKQLDMYTLRNSNRVWAIKNSVSTLERRAPIPIAKAEKKARNQEPPL